SAGSRVLVQRSIYDGFMSQLAERFGKLKVGPHDLDLDCGPLVTAGQKQRVEAFLKGAAKDRIAAVATGTIDPRAPADGYYVSPTLFTLVPEQNALAQQEVFG